jgi:uncharacterized repeat protein (TIGR02543 family)
MKFIKKISITFFLILSLFVFSNIAISQTVTADLPELRVLNQAELDELNNMPSVQTYNFKLDKAIYKAGDTVKGTFFIKNDRAYNLPDLKYTVSLAGEYDKRTGLPAKVYDSKPFGPVFLAGSEESKEVNFSYKLPESYAGDGFGIQIKTFTNAGIPLGWNSVLIKINGVSGVLKNDSAYIEVDGQKFSLQEGPTIKEGKKGEVHIFVSNPLKESASVSGKINIYNRTITGKLLGTYNTEFLEIKSGEKQEFVLDLNKYISEPGVYEGSFIILDKENVVRAQEIKFRYIIWGNIVTIQKVVADKEFINRGEIVNLDISYTGSPFDITNGETPDQKPMNTKIVLSDLKDNVVANYEGLIDYNKGASVKIPLTATKNADYIKIGLTVYDESGKVVTSYNSVLSDTTKERVQDSNNWSIIVLLIVIILAVITFVFRGSIKKRILSLFLILFFVFGVYQGANAGIITWTSGTGSVQNYISSQLYNSTFGGSSLTVFPGNQFTVSGTITTLSCNNVTQLNANTKARYNIIGKTSIDTNTNGVTAYARTDFNDTYDFENYSYTFPSSGYFSTTTLGNHRIPVQFLVYYSGAFQGSQTGYIDFTVAGVVLKANGSTGPITVDYGATTTLSWTSAGISTTSEDDGYPTGCRVADGNGWSGPQATTSSGITINNLIATSTYKLECYVNESLGTTTSSVLVNVRPAPTYTVSFNSQSATVPASPTTITVTVPATTVGTLPSNPTKTDGGVTYSFAGWYTAENGGGTAFTATTPVTANITVYAKWTAIPPTTYTVTYLGNGNTGGTVPDTLSYTFGHTVTVSDNTGSLTKTDGGVTYSFAGWLNSNDSAQYNVGQTFTMPASAVTLTAQWTANTETFDVTYHGNGNDSGVAPVDSTEYYSNDSVTILGNVGSPILAKDDYSFAGWSGNADGSGPVYSPGGTFLIDRDVDFYAKWDNSTFTANCCATRGSADCSNSVVVNNIMTWKISGIPETSATVSYTIDGTSFGPTTYSVNDGVINIAKIYTTVGQKDFSATATTPGLKTGICSTTTTVIQEGGGIIEF